MTQMLLQLGLPRFDSVIFSIKLMCLHISKVVLIEVLSINSHWVL